MVGDTSDDDRTNTPEHLQHLRSWCSQPQWYNLRAVGWCVRNEDAPWNTLQDLGSKEHALAVAEVEDEDESVQCHETADGRPSVADPAGDWTRKETTDECTNRTRALESRLP